MKTTDLLSSIDLFHEMTPNDLNYLASRTETLACTGRKIIFNAGDQGNDLYMIRSGKVEIYIPAKKTEKKVTLAGLTAGNYFGELSLFDKKPRSATAQTSEASEILVLKQEVLLSYITAHPQAAVSMLGEMSDRLRRTNALVSRHQSRNAYDEIDKKTTIADRIADKVASFGGSWKFILVFLGFIALWIAVNIVHFMIRPFDSYPFSFLNLLLAVVASIQAPFIMMSQNRQSQKDRLSSQIDYEVNLKNEVGIETALQKLDKLDARLQALERGPKAKSTARKTR
jgi:CRP/FNR family transcriptional regulator, cyclic AMP receptor protein